MKEEPYQTQSHIMKFPTVFIAILCGTHSENKLIEIR